MYATEITENITAMHNCAYYQHHPALPEKRILVRVHVRVCGENGEGGEVFWGLFIILPG